MCKGGSGSEGHHLIQSVENMKPNIMEVDKGKTIMESIKSKPLNNEFLLWHIRQEVAQMKSLDKDEMVN